MPCSRSWAISTKTVTAVPTPKQSLLRWQGETHETSQPAETWLDVGRARARGSESFRKCPVQQRSDQGRHPALADGHYANLGDLSERHRVDDHLGHQQERRRNGPSDRACGGRSGFELAALR